LEKMPDLPETLADLREFPIVVSVYNMRAPIARGHSYLSAKLLIVAVLCCALSPPRPAAGSEGGVAFLEKLSLNSAPSRVVVVCHGFGCAYRDQLVLTPARLSYLRSLLAAAHSAKQERKALAGAVAWLDREGGRAAGTVGRIARAGAGTKSGPSQMDCPKTSDPLYSLDSVSKISCL
jgi:hypothetical protein